MTVPLGSKASLITVTMPLLMKYPSVSRAASWTLSTLIIYSTNESLKKYEWRKKGVQRNIMLGAMDMQCRNCYVMGRNRLKLCTLPWIQVTYIAGKRKTKTGITMSIEIWNTFTLSPIRAFLSMIALLMCEFFPIPMGMPPFSARSFLSASVCRTTKGEHNHLPESYYTCILFYLVVVCTH